MLTVTVRTTSRFLHTAEHRRFRDLGEVLAWAAGVKEGGHNVNLAHDQDGLCAVIDDGAPKDILRKPW